MFNQSPIITTPIDNPGRGDCGIYAFANGLIEIIQEYPESKEASHIITQLVAYGAEDQKPDPEQVAALKNALLKTPFITKLRSKIKVCIPIDKDLPPQEYSLDEFLVRRLRVIVAEAFFNTYQDTKNALEQKDYIQNKTRALAELSPDHQILLQYLKQKVAEEIVRKEEDKAFENIKKKYIDEKREKENQFRGKFDLLTADQKVLHPNRGDYIKKQLDATSMEMDKAREFLDYTIVSKVQAFKKQIKTDFPDKSNDDAFLQCYAEEYIIEEFLTREGKFNDKNTSYGSFLFIAKTVGLSEQLKNSIKEVKNEADQSRNKDEIHQKMATNRYMEALKSPSIVQAALSLFEFIKLSEKEQNEALQNTEQVFFHIPAIIAAVKSFYQDSGLQATDDEFIQQFFLNTNSVYHQAILKALEVLKNSAYDRHVSSVWLDEVLLSDMAKNVFNVNCVIHGKESGITERTKKTITLENKRNVHWVSRHSPNSKAYIRTKNGNIEKYENVLTRVSENNIKEDIIAVLNCYLKKNSCFRFFRISARHHIEFAGTLLQMVKKEKDVTKLRSYLFLIHNKMTNGEMLQGKDYNYSFGDVNKKGDFYAAITSIKDQMEKTSKNNEEFNTEAEALCSKMKLAQDTRGKSSTLEYQLYP